MFATNHRLSILDDEATIIAAAAKPLHTTLHAYTHGYGEHEHPPLSDLVLHSWLLATHYSFAWLRIFATLFYLAGLIFLAACGGA